MVLQDAYERAQALLDSSIRPTHGQDIVVSSVRDHPRAWVFGYNSRRFLDDGDVTASVVGNGPVVVPKSGEEPFLASSATPVEQQLADLA